LDLLRADAERLQRGAAALGAGRRGRAVKMTVMTSQHAGGAMPGQRNAAVRARYRHAARGALEIGGEAAAVQEHQRLLVARERRLERQTELVRHQLAARPATHVDDL